MSPNCGTSARFMDPQTRMLPFHNSAVPFAIDSHNSSCVCVWVMGGRRELTRALVSNVITAAPQLFDDIFNAVTVTTRAITELNETVAKYAVCALLCISLCPGVCHSCADGW
jgi:hypothetical protein